MKIRVALAAVLLLGLTTASVWARGGGGCLAEGTLVATPDGPVPIERLAAGDTVWSLSGGTLRKTTVESVFEVRPDELLEISAGGTSLQVTAEHPLMIGRGEYRIASMVRPGDMVYLDRDGAPRPVAVAAVRTIAAQRPAFNLLVNPAGTFVASGLVVHNKGCFLPDTPILRADGVEVPLGRVRIGDEVMAFTPDGRMTRAVVRNVISLEVDGYLVVTTDRAELRVTAEHPFYVGNGMFRTLEVLRPGDPVYAWDGRGLSAQRIVRIETVRAPTRVFNLQTDPPNTYFAGGIAVHNKGGGGGGGGGGHGGGFGGGHGGGGGDNPAGVLIFCGVCVVLILIVVSKARQKRLTGNLDFVYSEADVARKAVKTVRLLEFLAKQDLSVSPADLRKMAEATFRKLQECWQAREYAPMKPLLMTDLFVQHTSQLEGLKRDHELDRIESLEVQRVDLVNVRYTEKADQREFTALITATARDYYVDDRTGQFLRGDEAPAQFQEFWTFHRQGDGWLLREIEQAAESEALKNENFVEMFTDPMLLKAYRDAAGQEGDAGPWAGKATGEKATRIERMLNFLSQTDKLWDRQQMLERARQVFMNVYLAQEAGDPARIPAGDLFPEAASALAEKLRLRATEGLTMEYRNLCVRKAELILVRNYADPAKDEYTVLISAHAQRFVRKGEQILSAQEYVSPFEEYWTFGRLDGQWKLKDVLPPASGRRAIAEENVDEDSTPEQLRWYYSKKRSG